MIVLVREKLGKLLENFSRFVVKIINFMRFLWNLWCQGLPLMVGRSTLISSLRLKSIININKCPSLIIVFIFHHWEFLLFPSCAVKLSRGEFWEGKRGKNSNSVQYYNQNTHNLFILSFSRMYSLSLTQSYFPLRPLIRHSVSIFSIKTYNIDGQFCVALYFASSIF